MIFTQCKSKTQVSKMQKIPKTTKKTVFNKDVLLSDLVINYILLFSHEKYMNNQRKDMFKKNKLLVNLISNQVTKCSEFYINTES